MFLISDAMAQSAPPSGPGYEMIIFIAIFFAIMYFMIIRPQQKRQRDHRKLIDSVTKGDEIVTTGGIFGKVTKVGENYLRLEVNEGVEIKLQKSAIGSVLPKGSLKQD